ncbi:MAG: hypothetical protein HYV26_23925 [Candidatus Hydrogenedentes bacterium]|nr:hypothetical protein [Candidatus Hydrogenedentota bacterium]
MRKLCLGFICLFASSGLHLAGCGPQGETPTAPAPAAPAAATGEPVPGDWIVERLEGEPSTLNVYLEAADAYSVHILDENVYQSLLERDNKTLEWKPLLAESWEVSEDHLVYTFHLRKDARFSDGVPLTSQDVKFTIEAILNPANDTATPRSYLIYVQAVETPDDHTVVIKCKQPYFLHMTQFATLWAYPKHVFETGDFNTHPANRQPVGTGPYKLEAWNTGQQLVLSRNENYWGEQKPHISKLVYNFIPDDQSAIQVLQQQAVDMMRVRSPQHWINQCSSPSFEAKFNKFEVYSPVDGYYGSFTWIGWNMRRPQLQDNRVRQAFTMLLDRQTILDRVFHGLGRVVSGPFFPDSPESDPNIKPWPFDPARAQQLLDEAGWKDTNSNGLRDKDGMELRFEWIYPTGSSEYDSLATVYKEELRKLGVEANLRPLEWASFIDSVTKRNFDACMMSWAQPVEEDPYQIWHSSQAEKGSNYVGFNIPEADQIIEAARLEFDDAKRAEMYRRLHQIMHDEQPYTFLYNRKRMLAVDKRFQNVTPYQLGFDIKEWWVPAQSQRYKE